MLEINHAFNAWKTEGLEGTSNRCEENNTHCYPLDTITLGKRDPSWHHRRSHRPQHARGLVPQGRFIGRIGQCGALETVVEATLPNFWDLLTPRNVESIHVVGRPRDFSRCTPYYVKSSWLGSERPISLNLFCNQPQFCEKARLPPIWEPLLFSMSQQEVKISFPTRCGEHTSALSDTTPARECPQILCRFKLTRKLLGRPD